MFTKPELVARAVLPSLGFFYTVCGTRADESTQGTRPLTSIEIISISPVVRATVDVKQLDLYDYFSESLQIPATVFAL
ncbi:hypothetical protein [Duganella sp. CF517]|uniref:hypothetical protein n=1 Tax=Duganella sp. CF517 TaxID=1881038 RepID=UPI00116039E3|nr:hypothetical protein [Duganella sp. CF517]